MEYSGKYTGYGVLTRELVLKSSHLVGECDESGKFDTQTICLATTLYFAFVIYAGGRSCKFMRGVITSALLAVVGKASLGDRHLCGTPQEQLIQEDPMTPF
jgi:hypothetical protein